MMPEPQTPRHSACHFLAVYATAGFFFPAANVFNFMQGDNALATSIAIGNLIYAIVLISTLAFIGNLRIRGQIAQIDRYASPLRVTSYCALAIAAILLSEGTATALFPGLAALFFGIGNFLQSRPAPSRKAIMHPAVWYGLGYSMTGIAIGGGVELLKNPLGHPLAFALTLIGIIESLVSLLLMAIGKVRNMAAPFVGVALGTLCFAIAGALTGNVCGVLTGLFACAGELSLGILMQQQHNKAASLTDMPASKIEEVLTTPIRYCMRIGIIKTL